MVDFKLGSTGDQTTGDGDILTAIRQHAGKDVDISSYLDAGRHIAQAMELASSIDKFINDHAGDQEIELCSKLGIVRSILRAEGKSKLVLQQIGTVLKLSYSNLSDSWYPPFFTLLNERCSGDRDQFFDNVAMIVFNYDRCVEHFLFHAIQDYYNIMGDEVAKIMEQLIIFHPYGKVGNLPWQSNTDTIGFGAPVEPAELLKLAHEIKTFGQRIADPIELNQMRGRLEDADTVVFLGFGFHQINMDLIKIPRNSKNKNVFATTRGISGSELPVVKKQIESLVKTRSPKMTMNLGQGIDCRGLFEEYQRNLIHS